MAQPAHAETTFGITGHYRVGCWTAVRDSSVTDSNVMDSSVGSNSNSDDKISLETLDGDGARVEFEQFASSLGYQYVIPGSEAAPLIIRQGDEVLTSARFPTLGSPSREPSLVPLGMSWVVCIGDPMGVEKLGANEILKRDAQIAVSQPSSAAELPDASIGYDGVDLIMITGQGEDLLKDLSETQADAITGWIADGGRLFVTLGESAEKFAESAPWLIKLLPLENDQVKIQRIDPAAIETYTATQSPLEEFAALRLPKGVGETIITGRTNRRVSTPLAAIYTYGFGRVTVLATDLDRDPFKDWPQRMDLITQLTGDVFVLEKNRKQATNQLTSFDDLVGQTRATLDQFSVKRRYGFSVLSLVLMALIALVGPLDYLLINRVLGKPLLGWLTFPIVALGLSAVLASQAAPRTDSSVESQASGHPLVQRNQIEVIDMDVASKHGRGFSWQYIYSHNANRFNVNVQPTDSLGTFGEVKAIRTAGFGNPGHAFGGIQISGENAQLPSYRVTASDSDGVRADAHDVSFAPRSSKSLATRLRLKSSIDSAMSMERRRGSELLQGGLQNPLEVDLLNGMLVYRNWVYLLPTRFPVGGQIEAVENLRQKNFRWQLSRQQALEKNAIENEAWRPSDYHSPDRIAEMLMFHDAVGGTRYTGLRDEPLAFLDLSDLLTDDRCILVGRVDGSLLDVNLQTANSQTANSQPANSQPANSQTAGDEAVFIPAGETLSMIRVVIPVKVARR